MVGILVMTIRILGIPTSGLMVCDITTLPLPPPSHGPPPGHGQRRLTPPFCDCSSNCARHCYGSRVTHTPHSARLEADSSCSPPPPRASSLARQIALHHRSHTTLPVAIGMSLLLHMPG
jgi:hypothetical protein